MRWISGSRERTKTESVFRLYDEHYLGEIAGYKVYIGGTIPTELAEKLATPKFINQGIKACEEEKNKYKIDGLGMNRGTVTKRTFFKKIYNTANRKVLTRQMKYKPAVLNLSWSSPSG